VKAEQGHQRHGQVGSAIGPGLQEWGVTKVNPVAYPPFDNHHQARGRCSATLRQRDNVTFTAVTLALAGLTHFYWCQPQPTGVSTHTCAFHVQQPRRLQVDSICTHINTLVTTHLLLSLSQTLELRVVPLPKLSKHTDRIQHIKYQQTKYADDLESHFIKVKQASALLTPASLH
jgi:hypothetical protein